MVAALGRAAQQDPFWGVRIEALRALGKVGGSGAEKDILGALNDDRPWVRAGLAVEQLGNFQRGSFAPCEIDRTLQQTTRPTVVSVLRPLVLWHRPRRLMRTICLSRQ